jgi:uncharacterized protein (DUF927 family)
MEHKYSNNSIYICDYNKYKISPIQYETKASKSILCQTIKQVFNCNQNCDVKSPIDFLKIHRHEVFTNLQNYNNKSDGLYYSSQFNNEPEIKICSPLKVLGKIRNSENYAWARLVKLTAPDGTEKAIILPMKDIASHRDIIISMLSDNGLEFNPSSKIKDKLIFYLVNASYDKILTLIEKNGWINDNLVYALPDDLICIDVDSSKYYYDQIKKKNEYQISGTLDDWIGNVGKYCKGNSLLVLLTSYMLTGPLLKLVSMEGGGLHIYGPSSSGKTTCASVAGSVCGGGGTQGFVRQWRTTSNALESTATMFNDGVIILDEIGQATSETVSQIAYMLPNSQGKERLKSDGTKNRSYTWRLNFLSTGEMAIVDKIEETGKLKAQAGQEVRIIEIPIDAGNASSTFEDLHGFASSNDFSIMLGKNSKQFYGTALRVFISCLIQNITNNADFIRLKSLAIDEFVRKNCPEGSSGQVLRAARKFGLIATAGEMGIEFKVFPYDTGEAVRAAEKWFKVWLQQREGLENKEILKAISNMKDHFDKYGPSKYIDLTDESRYGNKIPECYGYRISDRYGEIKYFVLPPTVNMLFSRVNKSQIINELIKLGYVETDKKGKPIEIKSINGHNRRGLIFKPSAWDPKSEPPASKPNPKNNIEESLFF